MQGIERPNWFFGEGLASAGQNFGSNPDYVRRRGENLHIETKLVRLRRVDVSESEAPMNGAIAFDDRQF